MATNTGLTVKKCLRIVRDVVQVTSGSLDATSLLSQLLRLLPCLQSPQLAPKDLSSLRRQIWEQDLVHLMVETLRNDYSTEREGWQRLTNLALTLTSVLAGIKPRTASKGASKTPARVEQVNEFYNILLPTSIDSILILASNMLEVVETNRVPSGSSLNMPECFKKVADSLAWLCSAHKQCIPRVVQSPYMLNVLISDHTLYSHAMWETLRTLVTNYPDSLSTISQDVLSSILDELVYKLSGIDKEDASLSLGILAQFAAILPNLPDTLSNNYTGLLVLVERWLEPDKEMSAAEKYLVSELRARAKGSELDKEQRAAVLIQASWRGYTDRSRLKKAQKGIQRFQQVYRQRKAKRLKRQDTEQKMVEEANLKQSQLKSGQLAFHERQLLLYEQVPASQLQDFIQKQETKAAVTIQSVWRGHSVRSKSGDTKERWREARRVKCAVVIQRAFRRHIARKKAKLDARRSFAPLPSLSKAEREKLQAEISKYRDSHTPATRTKEELSEFHLKAQTEYEKFVFSQNTRDRQKAEIEQLVTKLNRNCELLLTAPSLAEVSKRRDVLAMFSSSSPEVVRMARAAHREEMKAATLPWWEREPLDREELSLD